MSKSLTNDERRPGVLFAQKFCRDEIDVALAPAGALHNEQRAAPFQQMFNRLELARTERGLRIARGLAEKIEGLVAFGFHGAGGFRLIAPPPVGKRE